MKSTPFSRSQPRHDTLDFRAANDARRFWLRWSLTIFCVAAYTLVCGAVGYVVCLLLHT